HLIDYLYLTSIDFTLAHYLFAACLRRSSSSFFICCCAISARWITGARQQWQTASAKASAASAGFGASLNPRIRVIIVVICFLSARPLPEIAFFTSEGVYI